VSPSWRDRFTAVVAPEAVALVRRRHGWSASPELHADVPCAAPTPQAALDALRIVLARDDVGTGTLTLLLSNHFVHYLLLPWRAEIGQPAELAAYAAVVFDETFGSEPGGRTLLTARARAPGARVAIGLDPAFLAGLRAAVTASSLRLVSIQPYLPAVFDRLRPALPARDFMFVLAEPTRSCLMLASGGGWRSLRSIAVAARPRELANMIEREAQLAGLAEEGMPPVFVHAPGQEALHVPACQGVVPQGLACPGGSSAAGNPLLAMAMAVA
jgi:hypothetical protein